EYALTREVHKVEQHIDDADVHQPDDRKLVKFPRLKTPVYEPHDVAAEPVEAEPAEDVEPMTLEATERETIKNSLERNGGKRKKTAQELRISERTLYRKIKEYGLE
ncbi:MAG: helix-turn-helix domain-containing protein, partial [Bacteroidales bacterium]|nr:helix-turn-helix domain-containing protein [Bacteroidales bacterium]